MSPAAAAAVATAAQRALANPAASRALASGFQRASSSLSGNTASGATSPSPNADHALTAANVGRVAAAAQAFSATAPPARGTTPLAPPGPGPAAQRANSGGLVPQKVRAQLLYWVGGFTPPPPLPYAYTHTYTYTFSLSLLVVCCAKRGYGAIRNSETSTCRPPVRCSAPCAGRPPQRTRRPRRCKRRRHSQRRKSGAALRRPPCAASPHMCPNQSQSRNHSRISKLRAERKRPDNGRRRYTII